MSIRRLKFRTSVTPNAIDSFDYRITSRVVERSYASISRANTSDDNARASSFPPYLLCRTLKYHGV